MGQFTNLLAMARKPYYVIASIFSASDDLSWIPDAGFSLPTITPAETADGSRTEFTFSSVPKAILYNGNWLFEGAGYTRSGLTVTFVSEVGVFAPETGADIRGVV